MTELFRRRAEELYLDLRLVIEKDPGAQLGPLTFQILSNLVAMAAKVGEDADFCEALASMLPEVAGRPLSALEGFLIAGQLTKLGDGG